MKNLIVLGPLELPQRPGNPHSWHLHQLVSQLVDPSTLFIRFKGTLMQYFNL